MTSVRSASFMKIAWPSSLLRFKVIARLLRCRFWKSGPSRRLPVASTSSPEGSILITWAPQSASCRTAVGPARSGRRRGNRSGAGAVWSLAVLRYWICALCPSRQPLDGFLRMRPFLNAINGFPHAEEAPEGPSRSTRDVKQRSFTAARALHGGARADAVGNLAGEELAVAEAREELAVLHHDLAAQDRHARPGRHFVALPRRVVGLVQILLAQYPPGARVEQHDVGVRADRQRPFARVEAHDARCIRRGEPDKIGEAVAALLDHVGVHQRQPGLDPGIAAGRVVDAPSLQLHLERTADLVGGDRLDRAVIGRRPQRLLVLGEFERGIGMKHLAARALVVLRIVEQVLVQGLAIDRKTLGP